MKKSYFILLSILSTMCLASCGDVINEVYENKYVVIWQNYNGDILEIDRDLKEGTFPTYDSNIPTRKGDENYNYQFIGWTPEIVPVNENVQYTATFKKVSASDYLIDDKPTFNSDNTSLKYGYYPQTHVSDENLIKILNTLESSSINGWYLYNKKYYAKEVAKTFNNTVYYFDDETEIISGNTYWFEVESIEWKILSNDNKECYILSNKLLDTHAFYKDYEERNNIYPNNYEYSDIRNYLNNDFYNYAFIFNTMNIKESSIDNSSKTTDADNNKYVCANTVDKVFLPSYKDYLNVDYGFENNQEGLSLTREASLTDYARIKNAWCNVENNKYTSSYWTRSPSSKFSYSAINVNSKGYLSDYAVDGKNHCLRPSIFITL